MLSMRKEGAFCYIITTMFGGKKLMKPYSQNPDDLRQKLLDDVYAGAFAGTPAMLLEEDEIQKADDEELEEIARRHGIK